MSKETTEPVDKQIEESGDSNANVEVTASNAITADLSEQEDAQVEVKTETVKTSSIGLEVRP